jgi:hypothetical protein
VRLDEAAKPVLASRGERILVSSGERKERALRHDRSVDDPGRVLRNPVEDLEEIAPPCLAYSALVLDIEARCLLADERAVHIEESGAHALST